MTRQFRVLGTSDEITTCDCCARTGLKSTVALLDLESEETLYFGCTCAAKAMNRLVKDIKSDLTALERAAAQAKAEARQEAFRIEQAAWVKHLISITGGRYLYDGAPAVLEMIQVAGGMTKARQGFVNPLGQQ